MAFDVLLVAQTFASEVESAVCDDAVDVANEQLDPIDPVGVGVVIVVAVNESKSNLYKISNVLSVLIWGKMSIVGKSRHTGTICR